MSRKELEMARLGDVPERRRKGKAREVAGDVQIQRELVRLGIVVHRAPKGMQRSRENETSWSRGPKCIYWQVEWLYDNGRRALGKILGKHPLGEAYLSLLDDQRRSNMTPEEKQAEKKRKAIGQKMRASKKIKPDDTTTQPSAPDTILQDPISGTWSFASAPRIPEPIIEDSSEPMPSMSQHLYLLRARTPTSFPKVLVPLDLSKPLDNQLKRRALLEFPTIYVFETGPGDLPEQFMLEEAFIAATGQKPTNIGEDGARLVEELSNSDDDESSDSGSSDSDSGDSDNQDEDGDVEMEDGEIV